MTQRVLKIETSPKVGDKLFTYGTLRPGAERYDVIEKMTKNLGPAVLHDAVLYSINGRFPGLALTTGTHDSFGFVKGDLLEITHESLPNRLDQYEGYPYLYTRQIVETDQGPAWAYVFNQDLKGYEIIESGDWFDQKSNS